MTPLTLNFGQFASVDFELFEGYVIGNRADGEGPHDWNEDVLCLYDDQSQSRRLDYTGITNSLERRTWYHRSGRAKSFTKTYNVDRLVYYERFNDARSAIAREKEIKGWRREKKNELVRALNPTWKDLGQELFDPRGREVTRREHCK